MSERVLVALAPTDRHSLNSPLKSIINAFLTGSSSARLVFLGSKQSRQTTVNESCGCESASTKVVHGVFCRTEFCEKPYEKENGGISQADQCENHRVFRSLSR